MSSPPGMHPQTHTPITSIISWIVSPHQITGTKAQKHSIDKTLRLATADSTTPHRALDSYLLLQLDKLALEVGLLELDFVAQSFESLSSNVGFFSRGSPTLDRVFHGLVGQEVPLVTRGPAGINAQGVNGFAWRVLFSTR